MTTPRAVSEYLYKCLTRESLACSRCHPDHQDVGKKWTVEGRTRVVEHTPSPSQIAAVNTDGQCLKCETSTPLSSNCAFSIYTSLHRHIQFAACYPRRLVSKSPFPPSLFSSLSLAPFSPQSPPSLYLRF